MVGLKYAAPKPIAVGEEELRAAISTMMGDTFEVRAERNASMPLTSGGKRSYVKSLTPAH